MGRARAREPGLEFGRVREDPRHTAGMEEEHAAPRGDAPGAHMRDEPRHRLAGVDGIEQQRLESGRHRHRLVRRVVELAVARRKRLVADIDVAFVERIGSSDHRGQFRRARRDSRALPGYGAAHADAVHRHLLADRPHPHQDARMGERAARGAHHRVEPQAPGPRLLHRLVGGDDIAEPAERRMLDAKMDHIRLAALVGERLGEAIERRIRRRLVLPGRKRMQCRPEQPVDQHVAGGAIEIVGVVHPLFELNVDIHPELARAGGGGAHEVRLHRPGIEHGIGAARLRFAEIELELTHLVPSQGEPGAIVALDPELDAKGGAEVRCGIERRRRMAEPDPGVLVDPGEWSGHGVCGGAVGRGAR